MSLKPALIVAVLLTATVGAQPEEVKSGLSGGRTTAPSSRLDVLEAAVTDVFIRQTDALFDEGEFPAIIDLLRHRADLDSKDYELWTDLIWMYGNVQDRERELAAAIEYRTLNPNDPEAWYPQAQVLYFRGLRGPVIPLLEKSISLGVAHPNSYRMLAQCWLRTGFPRQAVRVWRELLKHYPDDARAKAQLERTLQQLAADGS